jgi:hypothetical protein
MIMQSLLIIVNDFYKGQHRSLFGIQTNNFVESNTNNNVDLANHIQTGSPFDALYRWMYKQLKSNIERSINSYNWKLKNFKLTPYAQHMLKVESNNSGYYSGTCTNFVDGMYNECIIQHVGISSNSHYVDLGKNVVIVTFHNNISLFVVMLSVQ